MLKPLIVIIEKSFVESTGEWGAFHQLNVQGSFADYNAIPLKKREEVKVRCAEADGMILEVHSS